MATCKWRGVGIHLSENTRKWTAPEKHKGAEMICTRRKDEIDGVVKWKGWWKFGVVEFHWLYVVPNPCDCTVDCTIRPLGVLEIQQLAQYVDYTISWLQQISVSRHKPLWSSHDPLSSSITMEPCWCIYGSGLNSTWNRAIDLAAGGARNSVACVVGRLHNLRTPTIFKYLSSMEGKEEEETRGRNWRRYGNMQVNEFVWMKASENRRRPEGAPELSWFSNFS